MYAYSIVPEEVVCYLIYVERPENRFPMSGVVALRFCTEEEMGFVSGIGWKESVSLGPNCRRCLRNAGELFRGNSHVKWARV